MLSAIRVLLAAGKLVVLVRLVELELVDDEELLLEGEKLLPDSKKTAAKVCPAVAAFVADLLELKTPVRPRTSRTIPAAIRPRHSRQQQSGKQILRNENPPREADGAGINIESSGWNGTELAVGYIMGAAAGGNDIGSSGGNIIGPLGGNIICSSGGNINGTSDGYMIGSSNRKFIGLGG